MLRRAARNVLWGIGTQIVLALLAVSQIMLISRTSGASGLGLYGWASALGGLIVGIVRFNNAEVLLYFLQNKEHEDKIKIVRYCLWTETAQVAVSCVIYLAIVVCIYPSEDRWASILFGSGAILVSLQQSPVAILRHLDDFRLQFKIVVGCAAARTLLIGLCYARGATITQLAAVLFLSGFMYAIVAYLALPAWTRLAIARGSLRDMREGMKLVQSYQVATQSKQIIKAISRHADSVLLASVGSSIEAVGIYRASKQISEQVQNFGSTIVNAVFPEYARLSKLGSYDALRKILFKILFLGAIAFPVVSLLAWYASPKITDLVFGFKSNSAEWVVTITIISAYSFIVFTPFHPLLAAFGRAKESLIVAIVALLVQAAAIVILVPYLSEMGAALSALLFVWVYGLIMTKLSLSQLRETNE